MADLSVEYEITEEPETETEPGRCRKCQDKCLKCLNPVLAEHHPLPPHPNIFQRLHFSVLCPPHGLIGATIFVLFFGVVLWGVLWALTGKQALPDGNFYSLTILFFACWCGGFLIQYIKLPPLLGMLSVGLMLGSVPGIDVAKHIDHGWSSAARQMALAIILIRAGLGLDPAALRRLSFVVIRLAFSPCLAETVADAVAAHLILGFPWPWGFMLGFVIAAVSPAVVVPSLLHLAERGYGLDKGIPTLVIAASSVDDVLAITGFGVVLGITFSSGDLAWNLFKGPLEAIVGVVFGIVGGVILWYIPQKQSKHRLLFRATLLVGIGLLAIFGSKKIEWSGVGPLGCLTVAFVAALGWRKERSDEDKDPVEEVMSVLWMIFQPLLFGLIGAAVRLDALSGETVGLGIAVLGIGLVIRIVVAYLAVFGTNLNLKERLFVPLAWLPKATVQAAIGAVAYDQAKEIGNEDEIALGEKVLTLAVLSILLTAPVGAGLVAITGPLLLKHTSEVDLRHRKMELRVDEESEHAGQGSLVHSTDAHFRKNKVVAADDEVMLEATPLNTAGQDELNRPGDVNTEITSKM